MNKRDFIIQYVLNRASAVQKDFAPAAAAYAASNAYDKHIGPEIEKTGVKEHRLNDEQVKKLVDIVCNEFGLLIDDELFDFLRALKREGLA